MQRELLDVLLCPICKRYPLQQLDSEPRENVAATGVPFFEGWKDEIPEEVAHGGKLRSFQV